MHINIGLSLNYLLQEFFLPGTSRNYGEKLKSVCILLNFSELSFIEHLGWLFLKKTIFVKNMSECFWRLNITNFFLLSVDTRHSVHWGATSPPSKTPFFPCQITANNYRFGIYSLYCSIQELLVVYIFHSLYSCSIYICTIRNLVTVKLRPDFY